MRLTLLEMQDVMIGLNEVAEVRGKSAFIEKIELTEIYSNNLKKTVRKEQRERERS